MGVSNGFPSDSHAWSALIRHNGEEGMFFNAAFVVGFVEFFERLSEVDDETGVVVRTAQKQFEAGRQRWATSSPSTSALPQPDAGERERIGATEAANRMGISRVRFGQRCRRGDFASARQDDRGWWSIDVAEVDASTSGSGGEDRTSSPSDPPGGDR